MNTRTEHPPGSLEKLSPEASVIGDVSSGTPFSETVGRSEAPPPKRAGFKKPILIFLGGALVVAAVLLGVSAILNSMVHETTDDAFIDGHIISVSPKVSGRVASVNVSDNQFVKKGEVLVVIDPEDFKEALDGKKAASELAAAKQTNAEASLEQAKAHLATLKAAYDSMLATVTASQADASKAKDDMKRSEELRKGGAISIQDLMHATTTSVSADATLVSKEKQADAARAYMNEAKVQIDSATAQVAASRAEVSEAKAAADQAELSLSYTQIVAPEAGLVTNKSVETGSYVQVGQALLALVPKEVWVTANFKETQLTDIRPGQPVKIKFDAYPGRTYDGQVQSIQAGSGARFSLLPPENATGNFVKVVQRVPVKITLNQIPDEVIGPGMSAVPAVTTGEVRGKWLILAVAAIVAILVVMAVSRKLQG